MIVVLNVLIKQRAVRLLKTWPFIPEFVVQTCKTQTVRPSICRPTLNSMLWFTKIDIRDSICPSAIVEEIVLGEWPDCYVILVRAYLHIGRDGRTFSAMSYLWSTSPRNWKFEYPWWAQKCLFFMRFKAHEACPFISLVFLMLSYVT